jgi:hypothetical protein
VERALSCLANLAVHPDNEGPLLSAVPLVLAALGAHAGSPHMVAACLVVLRNLAFRPDNAGALSPVLPAVLASMETHAAACGVATHGLGFLSNLAIHPALRPGVVAAGALPLVVHLMEVHRGSATVGKRALCALRSLADHPDLQAALGVALPTALTLLDLHRDQPGMVEAGLGFLRNLACAAVNYGGQATVCVCLGLCLYQCVLCGSMRMVAGMCPPFPGEPTACSIRDSWEAVRDSRPFPSFPSLPSLPSLPVQTPWCLWWCPPLWQPYSGVGQPLAWPAALPSLSRPCAPFATSPSTPPTQTPGRRCWLEGLAEQWIPTPPGLALPLAAPVAAVVVAVAVALAVAVAVASVGRRCWAMGWGSW